MKNVQTFGVQSNRYAQARPTYPKALPAYLSSLTPEHRRVWDCATGNGQFAVVCADFFAEVVATDISAAQVRHAIPHPNVKYSVGTAEEPPFKSTAFDMIVVAQAVHWFNLERFYGECRRLLKPGGVLAVFGYAFPSITPKIDALIDKQLLQPIDPFWAVGNRLIMDAYRSLPFPLAEIRDIPPFAVEVVWNLEQFVAYLRTWSAVKRYITEIGTDPVGAMADALRAAWGSPDESRTVKMPLAMKVAVNSGDW